MYNLYLHIYIYISYIYHISLNWNCGHCIALHLPMLKILSCSSCWDSQQPFFFGLQICPPYFSWETDPTDDTWRSMDFSTMDPHIGIFSVSYLFHDQYDSQSPAGAVARSWGLFQLPEVCGEWQGKSEMSAAEIESKFFWSNFELLTMQVARDILQK